MRASSPIEVPWRRRALLLLVVAVANGTALVGCASAPPPATGPATPPAVRTALAPTGTLRIAVYPGSPTSLVREAPPDEMRGVSVEIGRELARRLGVPSQVVVFPRVAEVVAALQRGEADVTVTNATPERAKLVDFTSPLLALELGVLVPAGSAIGTVDGIDVAGLRVGVSQGGSSERALTARLKQATVVPMPTMQAATQALANQRIDAFATNKGILFDLADKVPGARVLDGRWGLEHLALATGQGRDAALPWLRDFAKAVQAEGHVQRAADRAGLRGTAAP